MQKLISTSMLIDEGEVDIDGIVHYDTERNYGEDADGNRGERRDFITSIQDVTARDIRTGEEVELSEYDCSRAIEKITENFLYQ